MASERDLQLLDDYIGNRLSPQQHAEFEQRLSNDVELKNEYHFQNQIASGIRKARTAELKTMLNNVSVASAHVSQTSLLTKIAGVAVIAGVIITGIYYFAFLPDNTTEPAKEEVVNTPVEPQASPENVTPQAVEPQAETAQEKKPEVAQERKSGQAKSDAKTDGTAEQAKEPSLDVFDPSAESEAANEKPVQDQMNSATILSNSTITVVTDNSNKKYTFHYQFKDGKLFLFGSFEKNLYEILEFFSDNKRTIFLYYKNNYYLLDEGNEKVKALSPINDPELLKKLKESRSDK